MHSDSAALIREGRAAGKCPCRRGHCCRMIRFKGPAGTRGVEYEPVMRKSPKIRATHGSGNVFADLGFPEADVELAKADLAICVQRFLDRPGLTLNRAALLLKWERSKIPPLFNGQLSAMTIDGLLRMIAALGNDVDIVITSRGRRRKRGSLRVVESRSGNDVAMESLGARKSARVRPRHHGSSLPASFAQGEFPNKGTRNRSLRKLNAGTDINASSVDIQSRSARRSTRRRSTAGSR